MDYQIYKMNTEDAFGALNEVEKKNAPEILYLAGDKQLLSTGPRVSIVGSREASKEGLQRAASLAKHLAKHSVTVVSGLAKGIDAAAHKSSMENGGRTIAVLGTPLDKYYPKENKYLQDEIAAKHLLVSQFEVGQAGGKKNFPMRNRTMALISDVTVIVEAADGSGSLHQGWEALRLGRPLLLMESIVKSNGVSWPAEMIKYGAKVLTREDLPTLIETLPRASREEIAAFAF